MMGFGMLLGLPLMLLTLLILVAVPVLVLVWLVRGINPVVGQLSFPAAAPTAIAVCPNCHRGVQAGWQNCAYCGQKL